MPERRRLGGRVLGEPGGQCTHARQDRQRGL